MIFLEIYNSDPKIYQKVMRIQDYGSYSVQKNKNFTSEFTFTSQLGFLEVKVINRPSELLQYDDLECIVEYEAAIERKKEGIQDLNFKINLIEMEFRVDGYPEDPAEYDFEIVPGENIDAKLVKIQKEEILIPSNPSFLLLDMGKSMRPADFKMTVHFGKKD